jgi:hypothetical protein
MGAKNGLCHMGVLDKYNKDKFVTAYLSGKTQKECAVEAGVPESIGTQIAAMWLQSDSYIRNAITTARQTARDSGKYTLEDFMAELKDAMGFSKEVGNANALMKGIELRGKANGLLNDKLDVNIKGGFVLNIGYIGAPQQLTAAIEPKLITIEAAELPQQIPSLIDLNDDPFLSKTEERVFDLI